MTMPNATAVPLAAPAPAVAPAPRQVPDPAAGGCYIRDPLTGALSPAPVSEPLQE
jgi:hypothetical protein